MEEDDVYPLRWLFEPEEMEDDQTRLAKIYRMLVNVLRPGICTFLDGRIIPYRSMKEFINAHTRLRYQRYIPLSTLESTLDLDISALYAITTDSEILQADEKRDLPHNKQVPGNLILWVSDYWDKIVYMAVQNNTFLDEDKYEIYIRDFLIIAERLDKFNNQKGKCVHGITAIQKGEMSVKEVRQTMADYQKSCLKMLSPEKFVDCAMSSQNDPRDPTDKIRFAKSYLILTDVIKPAICTFLDLELAKRGIHSMQQFLVTENLYQDKYVKRHFSKMTSTLDLDVSALNIVAQKSHLLKSDRDKRLIRSVNTLRNDLVHSPYPDLNNGEYNEYLQNYKLIAYTFEKLNDKSGSYLIEIESIERKMMNEERVKEVIHSYNTYCTEVLRWIIEDKNVESEHVRESEKRKYARGRDSFTTELAGAAANLTQFPPAQALLGVAGGAVGLAADGWSFLFGLR